MSEWPKVVGLGLASLLTLTGCGQGMELVGSWQGQFDSGRLENYPEPLGVVERVWPATTETWLIQSCGADELAARVAYGCLIRVKATSPTEAEVLPDYPCEVEEARVVVHLRTVGGSVKRTKEGLVATVKWRGLEPVTGGNVLSDYSATLTATTPTEVSPLGSVGSSKASLCTAAPEPATPDDFASLAECTAAEIVDLSGASESRTLTIDANGIRPRCLRIAAGQSVTFNVLALQPVWPGTPERLWDGSAPNPIRPMDVAPDQRSFTFPAVGDFLYRCTSCPQVTSTSQGLVRVR